MSNPPEAAVAASPGRGALGWLRGQVRNIAPFATLAFDDIEEVAEQANKNIYGLASAIWTNDLKKAHQLSRRLKAGTVWINTYGLMDASLPFGGFKQSGFGRELGMHAIEHYTELKTVWMNL